MKHEFSAGVIVYYKTGNSLIYLLIHAPSGYWGFPKGKIEQGESKRAAALREVKEETGLDAVIDEGFEHNLSYFFKDKKGELIKKTVYFFVGQASSQEVTLSSEHTNYQWLPFQEALQAVTYDNDRDGLIAADDFLFCH